MYSHKLDYCVTCARKKELSRSKQAVLNRIWQTGSADANQQSEIESKITKISWDLKIHHERAKKSHDYYKHITGRCNKEWEIICETEAKENRNEQEHQTLKTSIIILHWFSVQTTRCKS